MTRLTSFASRFLGGVLLALLGLACGGGGGDAPEPDAGMGAWDGPPPVSLEAAISPGRAFYQTGQEVRVRTEVLDAEGNVLEGVPLLYRAEPATSAQRGEAADRFVLESEGAVIFEACTAIDGQEALCDAVQILVDDGSPMLEVSAPSPGAEIGGEGVTRIPVEGSVATGGVSVTVNGMPADVDAMGRFTAEVEPRPGVNHLRIVASDGLSEPSIVERAVLFAERYLPATAEGRPALRTDETLVIDVGRALLDDGVPFDPEAMPLRTDDLEDLAELLLAEADLASLLPDPLLDTGPGLQLSATSVRTEGAEVDLAFVEEGLELFARLPRLAIDTNGALDLAGFRVDLTGGLDVAASLVARVRIRRESAEMPLEVSLEGLALSLEAVAGRFASEDANALLALAESGLARVLEDALTTVVTDLAADLLPGLVTDLLATAEGALTGVEFSLDIEGLPATTLLLDAEIGAPRVDAGQRMQVPLDLFLRTDADAAFPASPGAADFGGAEDDPFVRGRQLQVGARLAVLNQALHVIWNSGLLDLDVTSLLPEVISGLITRAEVFGRLPPVVRLPRGNETGDLVLSIGQLELELDSLDDTTVFGLNLSVGASLTQGEDGIGLALDAAPRVHAWIISTEGEGPPLGLDGPGFADLFVGQLWGTVQDLVADLSFSLPAFGLPLEGFAPALEGFELAIELPEGLETRGAYLVVPVSLRGRASETPAAP